MQTGAEFLPALETGGETGLGGPGFKIITLGGHGEASRDFRVHHPLQNFPDYP